MQRNFKRLLLLLMLYLYLSRAFSASATRTQNLNSEDDSSAMPSLTRLDHVVGNGEEVLQEELIERRVSLESQDYEGTGANKDHDPKSPGGV